MSTINLNIQQKKDSFMFLNYFKEVIANEQN